MNTETKPICVIYLPENLVIGKYGDSAPMELMQILNGNFGQPSYESKFSYNDYWKDYYWFCFHDYEIQTPRFEVFNVKDFDETKFSELKKIIDDAIEAQKNKK